jgi:hypothetical protein
MKEATRSDKNEILVPELINTVCRVFENLFVRLLAALRNPFVTA